MANSSLAADISQLITKACPVFKVNSGTKREEGVLLESFKAKPKQNGALWFGGVHGLTWPRPLAEVQWPISL